MAKGNRPASSSAEAPSLALGGEPASSSDEIAEATAEENLEAGAPLAEDALKSPDAEPQPAVKGPRVQVHAHGGVMWDGVLYEANQVFVVDTSKHTEDEFNRLVSSGTLVKPE
jgi:hypothetical protein